MSIARDTASTPREKRLSKGDIRAGRWQWQNGWMCGRFARYTPRKDFAKLAGLPVDDGMPFGETIPSWNTAPGMACTLVRTQIEYQPEMVNLPWGFIAHWCEQRPARRPINAKLETAAELPIWKRVFKYRRCLVAADGWFEWREEGGKKVPYYLCYSDRRPFFLGGLWDSWNGPDGEVPTFAILTQPPVESIAHIHDRMPVIVPPEHYAAWLSKEVSDPYQVKELCLSPAHGELTAYRVSTAVNYAAANGPQLIEPVELAE